MIGYFHGVLSKRDPTIWGSPIFVNSHVGSIGLCVKGFGVRDLGLCWVGLWGCRVEGLKVWEL